jgi:hypothetical protein
VVLRQERRFNSINLHLYHYARNSPVRYLDPDGKYMIVKSKIDGRYGFGSYNYGFNDVHYIKKSVSNLIP